jgi:hypothetical protein
MQMSILQKFLARSTRPTEGRRTMKRAFVASGSMIALCFAIALSVSPQLHERFHPDAKQRQHECAVTLIAAGNYHHSALAPLIAAPALAVQFSHIATLNPVWVPSPFLSASVFEHAPPQNS